MPKATPPARPEPLKRSDVPAGVTFHLGRLVTYPGRSGRPFVGVLVECRRCKRAHRYPWRWDRGPSADVVSYRESRCVRGPRRPQWVALDPASASEAAEVHHAAHEAYQSWEAAVRKAARPGSEASAKPVSEDQGVSATQGGETP